MTLTSTLNPIFCGNAFWKIVFGKTSLYHFQEIFVRENPIGW